MILRHLLLLHKRGSCQRDILFLSWHVTPPTFVSGTPSAQWCLKIEILGSKWYNEMQAVLLPIALVSLVISHLFLPHSPKVPTLIVCSSTSQLSHTLQPTHISWNRICLMVWNIPAWADHHSNFLFKCVVLIKPQAGVMWRQRWRWGAGRKHWGCYGGGSLRRSSQNGCVFVCACVWVCVLLQTWSDLLTTEDVGLRGKRQFSPLHAVSLKSNQIKETNNKHWKNPGLLDLQYSMSVSLMREESWEDMLSSQTTQLIKY